MAIVQIKILNNVHNIYCDEGQEEHIKLLAEKFHDRVKALASGSSAVPDLTLYLLAALLISDELAKLQVQKSLLASDIDTNQAVVNTLNMVVEYIEKLASKIEK